MNKKIKKGKKKKNKKEYLIDIGKIKEKWSIFPL
jgi:hypothetical protein